MELSDIASLGKSVSAELNEDAIEAANVEWLVSELELEDIFKYPSFLENVPPAIIFVCSACSTSVLRLKSSY
jgi:hypothetical protein